MRFSIFFLLIISHISYFMCLADLEPLLHPDPIINPDSGVQKILIGNIKDVLITHKHTGYDPTEFLIKAEFSLLVNLGIRLESLLESYSHIINEANLETITKPITEKMGLKLVELIEEIMKNVVNMIAAIKKIHKNYDSDTFELQAREPTTFMSLELIKSTFDFFMDFYNSLKEVIESSEIEEVKKSKFISTLKNKTIIYIFSTKIILLKMFYDVGISRKLRMRFIIPGIYYLLVFETGIAKRIMEKRLLEVENLSEFLKNYNSSTEELIDKALFYIKEDELPMDKNETLHKDLVRMHKDFNEIVDNIISNENFIIKGVKN